MSSCWSYVLYVLDWTPAPAEMLLLGRLGQELPISSGKIDWVGCAVEKSPKLLF